MKSGRSSQLVVESYDIRLDLRAPASGSFGSRTQVRFACDQRATIAADLAASSVESVRLNGGAVPVADIWDGARFELSGLRTGNIINTLVVDGQFPYAIEDRGMRRAHEPDGSTYVYSAMYPNSASRVFCCLDVPGSRAQILVSVATPPEWIRLSNDMTRPLEARLITCATGPWSQLHQTTVPRGHASPLPVAVHAQRGRAAEQGQGRQIADLIAHSITLYEHQLGVPYPYQKAEAVLVQGFPSLGFSAPGLIMFNDNFFDLIANNGPLYAATAVSHEVAHAWIGDLVDLAEDPWLVEAGATYLSRNAVRDLMPGCDGWHLPDSAIPDAGRYVRDTDLIKTLEHTTGREPLSRPG